MSLIPLLLKEFDREAETTRKMLSRIPDDKYDWKPHQKSMDVRTLSTHIADLPNWVPMAINTEQLDFADSNWSTPVVNSTADLLAFFEKSYKDGREILEKADESKFNELWTLRNGAEIYSTEPKYEVIRMSISQTIHHRAQLGVFLRLLNVPIPGSYGPSADEMSS
jgi:uncharacterized damage-inducible protein DinB